MDLSQYTMPVLKEFLLKLNLKTSGSKSELLNRLGAVDAVLLKEVCDEYNGEGSNDNNEIVELRELVQQLSAEVSALRASASVSTPMASISSNYVTTASIEQPSLIDFHNVVNTSPCMVSSTVQPCTPVGVLPGQQSIVYVSQPCMTANPFTPLRAQPISQNRVYSSQPHRLSQQNYEHFTYPTMTTRVQPCALPNTMSTQASVVYGSNSSIQQRPSTLQLMSQPQSLKDVSAIIPIFDPADDSYTSVQFIERIEQLKEAYGWNDAVLNFAVLSKLRGVAKRWADAQPVFKSWGNFVTAFLTDFPHVSDVASVHIALMKTKMNRGERFIDYYYRMLALGRRENIDDVSIIRYIINGLYDDNMKRTLSAMQFRQCSDLLTSMQNLTSVCHSQDMWKNRSFEVPKEQKPQHEKENLPAKRVFDANRDKENKNNNVICFKCRQKGHYARNCTQIREIRANNDNIYESVKTPSNSEINKENENEVQVNALIGKRPNELLKNVTIIAKETIDCEALIDSGSGKSLIKNSVASKCKPNIVECYEKLTGFAGGEMLCKQKIFVNVKIDDVTRQAEFLVVDDNVMSHAVLIGLDILSKVTVLIESGVCKVMAIKNTGVKVGNGLKQNILRKFREVVDRYEGCFGEELHELGRSRQFKMGIILTSTKPVYKKPYNIPIPKRKIVEEMVTNLLKLQIIRPSTSLYASPIVLVRKSSGEDRMCIDYRQLNAITEKQPWCMPTVEGVLSVLKGHSCFTTLDLMSGYYQIELEEECKHLTAFVTHQGHYEFNRMPFGLRNAPSTFQRMMSKLIEPMGDKIVSYVDEIIIATDTVEENLNVFEEFLSLVRNEGLTLRISKCSFLKSSVSFLGHIVDVTGIRPGMGKTDDVRNFPVPINQHEVRRFLGLTGFFRKFVANYASIAKPLTNLTRKEIPFTWSNDCAEAFRILIEALTSSPVLAIYNVNKEHQLHTDASSIGIAAILMQADDVGKWHAVAYFSRCCNNAERNYHAYELEVLAVVEACQRFRMYLLGKYFTVVTDCQSISTAKLTKPMVPRVARWLLKLQEYDFEIIHRVGESMKHVDAMSRAPNQNEAVEEIVNKVLTIETQDWVSMMQQSDQKLKEIMNVLTGRTQSEQKKHIEMQFIIKKHRLFYKTANSTLALVVPKGMRWRIVKLYHDDIGHPAIETVIKRMSSSFWFPRIRNFVKSYIKSCIDCAYHKEPKQKACQLYGMDVPSLPFQVLHLDHLGPFIKSKRGFEYVLVCVDALTRYVVIYPTRNTNTKPVVEALNNLSLYFGLPKTVVTDRGTAFTSAMFSTYCENNNIQHIKVAVRTPRSNGLAERVNQNVLTYLKTSTTDPKDWDSHLRMLQWTQNTKTNATTKFAPLDLIFDFPLRDISGNKLIAAIHDDINIQMNERREEAAKHIEIARDKWKIRFNAKHAKPVVYNEGDLVLIESPMPSTGESRKLQPKYKGPYVVTKVLRYDRYVVEDIVDNQRNKRKYSSVSSSDKMKPWCALFPELDDDDDPQQDSESE